MAEPFDEKSRSDQRRLIEDAWKQMERVHTTALGIRHDTSKFPIPKSEWVQVPLDSLPGYEIQAELHRGGQGVVYRATQVSTGQTVAIKVMLGGALAGPQQIARFEREIRVLAALKHPNIVAIHDSGIEKGVAYFVMDYVDGAPLDDFMARTDVALAQKLALYTAICDAVHAAHLLGVIHRDLKPNNILVDEQGRARILDFGLAKPTGDAEAGPSTMTETGQFVGSVPWASPEQAIGQPDMIDLRTDVYSLGVILYQLLTGEFPYSVKGRLDDVIQSILYQIPRPIGREVDSDIATVALKALQKEPERRYQSAGALGQDVHRYLTGEPIDARRSSVLYVLSRKVRRHKWIAVLAATLLFSLIGGAVVSTTLWQLAERRAEETSRQAEKAQAVTDFLSDMMLAGNIYSEGTAETTVREVVERAEQRLDKGGLAMQAETETALRVIIGQTFDSLGLRARALRQYERAGQLVPRDADVSRDALEIQLLIADSLGNEGRADDAKRRLEHTLASLLEHFPDEHELIARARINLGEVVSDLGDFDRAEEHLGRALQTLRTVWPDQETEAVALSKMAANFRAAQQFPEAAEYQEQAITAFEQAVGHKDFRTAIMISSLGDHYTSLGRYDEAFDQYQRALQIMRDIGGDEHPGVANTLGALGQMYRTQGKLEQAIDALSQSLKAQQAVLPAGSISLAYSMNNLAICYFDAGRLDEALPLFYQSLEIIRKIRGQDHPEISQMLTNISAIEFTHGNYVETIKLLEEAHEIVVGLWGDDHINTAHTKHNLGKALLDAGQLDKAEHRIRAALQLRAKHFGLSHLEVATSQDLLAAVLQQRKKLDEAEELYRKSLECRLTLKDTPTSIALAYNNLAHILNDQGRQEKALEHADQAFAMIQESLPAEHWRIAQVRANRAVLLARTGDLETAESELVAAIADLREKLGEGHPTVREYEKRLAGLYKKTSRPEKAEALLDDD